MKLDIIRIAAFTMSAKRSTQRVQEPRMMDVRWGAGLIGGSHLLASHGGIDIVLEARQ